MYQLNPHYMFLRYPDIAGGPSYKMYNKQIAKECMDITEEAVTWLKQKGDKLPLSQLLLL